VLSEQSAETAAEATQPAQVEAGRDASELLLRELPRLAVGFGDGREDEVFERRSTSFRSTTAGSIEIATSSPLPVTVAFTTPPPEVASTRVFNRSSCAACMSCCIFWICWSICICCCGSVTIAPRTRRAS
jgi:hypothetical protein